MIQQINIINNPDIDLVLKNWKAVLSDAIEHGHVEYARFLRVYRRVNQGGYDAVSQIGFRDQATAESLADMLKHVLGPAAGGASNLYRTINSGCGPDAWPSDGRGMVIVNPYRIAAENAANNAGMWNETKDMMENVEGFVSASFFETLSPLDSDYHFVSFAEWVSETAFLAPFAGADYQDIVEEYQDTFQICFTTISCELAPNLANTKLLIPAQ